MHPTTILSQTARRLGLAEFWRWWSGELRVALAPFVLRWWSEADNFTELVLDAKALTLVDAVTTSNTAPARHIEFQSLSADALSKALAAMLRDHLPNLRIAVAPELCLRKQIFYPQATAENLHAVVGFDMDRQTPFTAAQVYFDARVVERSVAGDKNANASIAVELVVVPRYVLEPILNAARTAGATVGSIAIFGDTGASQFELLSWAGQPRASFTKLQIANLLLCTLIVLCAGVAILLPIWQKQELIRELQPALDNARTEAAKTRGVESEFGQLAQDYTFAVGKKFAAYPVVEIVDEVTRLSPDTTWLQSFELKSLAGKSGAAVREVQITGEAASAARMIELFEQSKLLQNASQRSQTTRGSQTGSERFQIAGEVKARVLPAAANVIGSVSVPVMGAQSAPSSSTPPVLAPAIPPVVAPAIPAAPLSSGFPATSVQPMSGSPPARPLPMLPQKTPPPTTTPQGMAP